MKLLNLYRPTPALILGGSFLTIQIVQLVLLVLYEKVEYDTFTFYFSKVELMRWWTVDHHPVMTFVQEFLPIGYAKFQKLFAEHGYAANAGNFIVVLGVFGYFLAYERKIVVPLALFVFANNVFFIQYTGYKTDAPLAMLALLLLHLVSRPYFPFQFTALAAVACFMLSIKWTAGLAIVPAALIYIWRLTRGTIVPDRRFLLDLTLCLIVTAGLFGWLELGVYFETLRKTGSFVPVESYGLQKTVFPNPVLLLLNLVKYAAVCIVETFEPVWRLFWGDLYSSQTLAQLLYDGTLHAKLAYILNPGEMYQTLSVIELAGLISAGFIAYRCQDTFVRCCAVTALAYYAISMSVFTYDNFVTRYWLPAQVLSYVPLAYLAMARWDRFLASKAPENHHHIMFAGAVAVASFHLVLSTALTVTDHHRPLVTGDVMPFSTIPPIIEGKAQPPMARAAIYIDTPIERTFRGWQGFQDVYLAMRKNMTLADSLEIVFDTRAPDVDYSYPFLRDRHPSNTILNDNRDGIFKSQSTNVLCFSRTACEAVQASGSYSKVAEQGPPIALWKRSDTGR
jgi:hypothetical protein